MVTRLAEVPLINGYYLPDWFSIVMPEATENLILNPSVENNTTGYTAVGAGAAIARTLDEQRRGAYSLQITPAVGVASGVYYGTVTTIAGQAYTLSMDVLGVAGHVYNVYFADNAGARLGSSLEFVGTGYWQRVHISYPEVAALARRFYIVQDAGDVQPYYVDGWQLEAKAYPTTYCDGDLEGFVIGEVAYYWTGTYHGSSSVRAATTRSGGRLRNLKEFGFNLLGTQGLGLAPVINYSLPSNLGGAFYQSTVEGVRDFAIIGDLNYPKYYQLSSQKAALEEALSYNLTPYRQPLLLHFQETDDCNNPVGDEVYIKCLYQTGAEGNTDNLNAENFPLRFTAFDKHAITVDGDAAIELGYKDAIDYGAIIRLLPNGEFDNFAGGARGAFPIINIIIRDVLRASDGTIYICGLISFAGGVAVSNVAMYRNGVWAALGAGVDNDTYCIAEGPDGRIYFGGTFLNAGGAPAVRIAVWDPVATTWAALGAGCDAQVQDIEFIGNGDLIAIGAFANAGGAPAVRIAQWNGAAWNAIGAGLNAFPRTIKRIGGTNSVYIVGDFTLAGIIAANRICQLDVLTSTYSALGLGAANNSVIDADIDKNFYLHVVGNFTTLGGIANNGYGVWNGSQWTIPNDLGSDSLSIRTSPLYGDIFTPIPAGGIEQVLKIKSGSIQYFGAKGQANDIRDVRAYQDGSVVLYGQSLRYTGINVSVKNSMPDEFTTNPIVIIRQLANTSNIKLLRCHSMNQDATLDKTIFTNEVLSIYLDQLFGESSFTGNFTDEFFSSSYIKLPEHGDRDITVLIIESMVVTNDNFTQINDWKNLFENINLDNTDNGRIYVEIVDDGAGFFHTDLYSDAARLVLVGHTISELGLGALNPMIQEIVPDGANGIEGYINYNQLTNADADIYIDVGVLESYLLYKHYCISLSEARYT